MATAVAPSGQLALRALDLSTRFRVTRLLAGPVYLVETDEHLLVFDDRGTEIKRHRWSRLGPARVSSGRPEDDDQDPLNVTDVLIHEPSPMS